MKFFDSHCHLNDPRLHADLPGVLQRSAEAGVEHMAVVGYDDDSYNLAIALACAYDNLHAVVGIAPHAVDDCDPDNLFDLDSMAQHPRVVAVGETGFEGHYQPDTLDQQEVLLDRHAEIAKRGKLPLVIHLRDAKERFLRWLERAPDVRLIMHCYSGDAELAKVCVDRGDWISFAGPVTFKNARGLREVCETVPLERTLIETDSPYLSPGKYRGKKPCEPYMLPETARAVAEVHGVTIEEVARQTYANAHAAFQPEANYKRRRIGKVPKSAPRSVPCDAESVAALQGRPLTITINGCPPKPA